MSDTNWEEVVKQERATKTLQLITEAHDIRHKYRALATPDAPLPSIEAVATLMLLEETKRLNDATYESLDMLREIRNLSGWLENIASNQERHS